METANREEAAARARDVFVYLKAHGWERCSNFADHTSSRKAGDSLPERRHDLAIDLGSIANGQSPTSKTGAFQPQGAA